MPDVDEQEADAPAATTSEEPAAVSWGPTFGPETEADTARPARARTAGAPRETSVPLSWHPAGGPW